MLLLATAAPAAQAQTRFEYYRDVYGNGNWGWSQHGYSTYQLAYNGARSACNIGTPVSRIGQFVNGQLVGQWSFSCSGGPPVQPPQVQNIPGIWFKYYVPGQGWRNYNGQIAWSGSRPLAAATNATAQQWYNEIIRLLVYNYRVPYNQVGNYIQYGLQNFPSNMYKVVNGFIHLR